MLVLLGLVVCGGSTTTAVTAASSFASGRPSLDVAQLLAPMENFQSSWVASSIQGTTLAVPFQWHNNDSNSNSNNDTESSKDDTKELDAVVVVLRYTATATAGDPRRRRLSAESRADDNDENGEMVTLTRTMGGLRILPSERSVRTGGPSRWTMLGPTAFVAMTGLVADVDHLTRILLYQVNHVHRSTHDGSTMGTHVPLLPLQLVHALSNQLQDAGRAFEGRPYGIQALLIGYDPRRRRCRDDTPSAPDGTAPTTTTRPSSALRIYTLDPSGGYRHWLSGTAVGRDAAAVRRHLCGRRTATPTTAPPDRSAASGRTALATALRAFLRAQRTTTTAVPLARPSSDEEDRYEALLLWLPHDGDPLGVATIDPKQVDAVREAVVAELRESQTIGTPFSAATGAA